MRQLTMADIDGVGPKWFAEVDRTACDNDPPVAGTILDRGALNRGKTGNRPNPLKFDRTTQVPGVWGSHKLVPWPYREDDDERAVLVSVDHAFGPVPRLWDVGRTVGAVIPVSFRRTEEELAALWANEAGVQTEVINRAEFARAALGSGFGDNAVRSLFPAGGQPLEGYLPHLDLPGDGMYRSEPDVVWMSDDRTRVYIGEVKVAAKHQDERFSHRQTYLPWLVARRLWPDATVVPVFVWVPDPGVVLVSEIDYPGGDIVGARFRRTTQVMVHLSPLAGGGLGPVFGNR